MALSLLGCLNFPLTSELHKKIFNGDLWIRGFCFPSSLSSPHSGTLISPWQSHTLVSSVTSLFCLVDQLTRSQKWLEGSLSFWFNRTYTLHVSWFFSCAQGPSNPQAQDCRDHEIPSDSVTSTTLDELSISSSNNSGTRSCMSSVIITGLSAFCCIQAFNRLDEVDPHYGGQAVLLKVHWHKYKSHPKK